jgi:hypothetical protein
METVRISDLLQPFVAAPVLSPAQLNSISMYIDLPGDELP